jgi:hypothetical protein
MGTDYAEKERSFISGLKDDTGRDLTDWMRAIEEENLSNRNDIIDWLRQQGFPFARASWLERIHHNGGRLIYADGEVGPSKLHAANQVAQTQKPQVFPFAGRPPARAAEARATADAATPPPILAAAAKGSAPSADSDVATLLAAAKGLRPLAEVLISEIRRTVRDTEITAAPPLILLSAPRRYAALLTSAKELKLFADFGSGAPRAKRAEATKTFTPPYAQAILLNDVRQIDADLMALIASAHQRAAG